MIIPISSIPEAGLSIELTIPVHQLHIKEIGGNHNLHCKLHLTHQGEDILLRGEIALQATICCVRCLEQIPLHVSVPQFVHLVDKTTSDSVNLIPLLREEIFLVLPLYAKCQLDNKGNCPYTGTNWQQLSETAPRAPLHDPWSELDKLKKATN